jgi:DnaK suppressor protein
VFLHRGEYRIVAKKITRKLKPAKTQPAAKLKKAEPSSRPAVSRAAKDNGRPKPKRSSPAPASAPSRMTAPTGPVSRKEPRKPAVEKVAKSRLTPQEIDEFREMLLAKRKQIIGDMGSLSEEVLRTNRQDAAGDLSLMPNHMADLGSDNWEQEFTFGLIENERRLLREIDEALERINAGTYGICVGTGRAIGKARLLAKPWAKYCIEYARERERNGVF